MGAVTGGSIRCFARWRDAEDDAELVAAEVGYRRTNKDTRVGHKKSACALVSTI